MAKRKSDKKPDEVELVPEGEFRKALNKVISTSKRESDEQLARFQSANKRLREERRKN